ncbi:hypothetical protein EPN52_05315 [bacterium]|nr:MAG: hypothetical protein EPN52_05315 [bacterium]
MQQEVVLAIAGRTIAAAVLGAAIGMQRELVHRPAGLRTHMLVSIAACAFAEASGAMPADRVVAGVATGVGFLGAGAIVRQGLTASGLTTAASIWVAAAVGAGAGVGTVAALTAAFVVTAVAVIVLGIPDWKVAALVRAEQRVQVIVRFDTNETTAEEIREQLARDFTNVRVVASLCFERSGQTLESSVSYDLGVPVGCDPWERLAVLGQRAGIFRIDVA